jgi:ribosomal-protein-alanine N-acetyltransferase
VEPNEYADGTARIRRYLEHRGSNHEQRLFSYVALEKSGGALIGQVGLSRFFHPALASLGFGVRAEYWGRGYATEMAARMIAFGFDDLALHRISADAAIENEASIRVLKKIGMTYEGTARDCIWAQGRWWTESKYAILAGEYKLEHRAFNRTHIRRP